jgi:hypothetical protein
MGTYVQLWSGNGTLQTLCALSYVWRFAAPIRIFAKLLDFRTAGKLKKCQDAPRACRRRRYLAADASSTDASATRTTYARAGRHGIQCVTIEKAALRAATPITAASIITAVSREPMAVTARIRRARHCHQLGVCPLRMGTQSNRWRAGGCRPKFHCDIETYCIAGDRSER